MIPSSYDIVETESGVSLGKFPRNVGPLTVNVISSQINIADKTFTGSQISLIPDQPFLFYIGDKGYRGELRLALSADRISFDIINNLPIESYLAGVVGAEMPSYWEPEALKAQAVASRTYCLHIKQRFGFQRKWDVNKTQANQMYVGLEAESPKVWESINQTSGQVLNCRNQNGSSGIFPAYFSSICGGHTEDSRKVFGDSYPPLVGAQCPWCQEIAAGNVFFWPMTKLDKAFVNSQLVSKYPSLKKIMPLSNIVVDKESSYNAFVRPTNLKLVGANNQSDFIRAEDFRLVIDPTGRKIRSTICKITSTGQTWTFFGGRGFGHGVGMCQYGSQGMARKGATAQEILSHYYPDSWISRY